MADFEISVWKDVYDSGYREDRQIITVPGLINIVRGNEYRVIIEKIRTEQDKAKRTMLKTMLPAVTVSGTFRERKLHGLIKHSGVICMDFDDLGAKAESIRNIIKNDKFVYGYFISASGQGLAVFVRIETHRHTETFEALEKYFYEQYGLVADTGCKDIARLRFFSWDANAWLNTSAEIYNKFPKADKKPKKHYIEVPATKTDIGKIVQQATLKHLDITDGSYAEWQRLAASLATLGEAGRDYFHALSQFHAKYDHVQADRKFSNLLNSANGNITIGTFFYFAKRAGLDCNTEKAVEIARVCRETKRRKEGNTDQAIAKLRRKNVICTDEDQASQEEDIDLVKSTYENIDVAVCEGIAEVRAHIAENYNIVHNEITDENEWKDGAVFCDDDYARIYLETKEEFPKVKKADIIDIIRTDAKKYNPLKKFIEDHRHLIRQDTNNIQELAKTLTSDTPLHEDCFDADYEHYYIRKWFVGMIASIYGNVSPLLLALTGGQSTGKTYWFRHLLPEPLLKYYAEIKIGTDKDAFAAMTKNLLIMDDELTGKTRMEEQHLKELTSKAVFTYRPPYAKAHIHRRRLAMLAGTTNDEKVLSDPTGNRRIIPINVLEIDHAKYNAIDKTALFMEAVRLYESGESWELAMADIKRLETATVQHKSENFERELIELCFGKPENDVQKTFAKFMTTTEVILELEKMTTQKISIRKVGMELRMMGFERIMKRTNKGPRYGFLILENKTL